MKRRKGYYSISVVAKMFDVHQQTIRLYEKEGLITPERSAGGTRLFSEEDVDKLEEIINLTHKMGVNIAGVEMILKLQRKIKKLQDEMNKLFENTQTNLIAEQQELQKEARTVAEQILAHKKPARKALPSPAKPSTPPKESKAEKQENQTSIDDWKIEYDDK